MSGLGKKCVLMQIPLISKWAYVLTGNMDFNTSLKLREKKTKQQVPHQYFSRFGAGFGNTFGLTMWSHLQFKILFVSYIR